MYLSMPEDLNSWPTLRLNASSKVLSIVQHILPETENRENVKIASNQGKSFYPSRGLTVPPFTTTMPGTVSKRRLLFLAVLLILLISLVTLAGCHGYEAFTYTYKEDGVHFSFEYPARYRIVDSYLSANKLNVFHAAEVELEEKGRDGSPTHIVFMVTFNYGTEPDDTDWGEQILEQNKIMVAGVQGEEIVYTMGKSLNVWRVVYFNYGEQLWRIIMVSDEANADTDAALFDHLLKTFEILE